MLVSNLPTLVIDKQLRSTYLHKKFLAIPNLFSGDINNQSRKKPYIMWVDNWSTNSSLDSQEYIGCGIKVEIGKNDFRSLWKTEMPLQVGRLPATQRHDHPITRISRQTGLSERVRGRWARALPALRPGNHSHLTPNHKEAVTRPHL